MWETKVLVKVLCVELMAPTLKGFGLVESEYTYREVRAMLPPVYQTDSITAVCLMDLQTVHIILHPSQLSG